MLIPTTVGLAYGAPGVTGAFGVSCLLTAFAGGVLIMVTRGAESTAWKRENLAAVIGTWLILPLFAALPLYFATSLGWVGAVFESVSGLTTTGATALPSVNNVSPAVLLWRAMLQWFGGVATVVFVIVHLAHLGVGGMQLYRSSILHGEQDPLLTRLAETGAAVAIIFAILAVACFLALLMAGIPAFDALTHALSTVSTGGFSTRDSSIEAFASPAVEVILIVFMILGAANASLHWLVVRRQEFGAYWNDPEFLRFLFISLCAGLLLALVLIVASGASWGAALRHGIFAAISAITTTGFSATAEFQWPVFAPLLLLVLMLAGGCTGSTAGGLKTMRLMLLMRLARGEIGRLAHPHGVGTIRYGAATVDAAATRAVWAFFVVLAFGFGLLTIALAMAGLDFRGAAFAAAGALSNTVPGAGLLKETGFAGAGPTVQLLFCSGMILGRLEFFSILILFNPLFWRR